MAALNPTTDISSYIQTIFEDAMFVLRETNFATRLVTNFADRTGNASRSSSEYGSATVSTIGETDDLQSQSFTPSTLATVTPAEAGAQFFLPDLRVESDPFTVRNDAAQELGMATAKKINVDIIGNFSSLTGGTVGSAGTTITWGHFFAALSRLKDTSAMPPYMCVLHHFQWHELAKAASPAAAAVTNSPAFQDEVMRRWFVGRVAEVDIFTTTDITIDASDDAYGAMFARSAIAYDQRRAPRLEPERDASRRGWELNMSTVYGHGVWRPGTGITMLFDAATPSS